MNDNQESSSASDGLEKANCIPIVFEDFNDRDEIGEGTNLSRNALQTRHTNQDASARNIGDIVKTAEENDDKSNKRVKQQKEKKISLLEKVNEIIKSCVKLKEDKKINEAKEKDKKLLGKNSYCFLIRTTNVMRQQQKDPARITNGLSL